MNPIAFISVAVGAALVLVATGLFLPAANDYAASGPAPLALNLTMDKAIYYSGNSALAVISLAGGSGNATLRVTGVRDNRGSYRISGEREVALGRAGAEENFSFNMPTCYGCAGVAPGGYDVLAELVVNGTQVANATVRINLEK